MITVTKAGSELAKLEPHTGGLTSVELFTGAGGLALGVHRAGFFHLCLYEWDANACETLRRNSTEDSIPGIRAWHVLEGDVRRASFGDFGHVDLVAGGPPCQPFSIGGKHKGFTDQRNMIPEFIRAVREIQPRAFIMENVKGLIRPRFRNYLEYVRLQLEYPMNCRKRGESWLRHFARLQRDHASGAGVDLSYNVLCQVLNAADYGVPQTRERVFIVGLRADLHCDWHFPPPSHGYDSLLMDQWVTGSYWERHGLRKPALPTRLQHRVQRLAAILPPQDQPWRTVRDSLKDLPEPTPNGSHGFWNHRLQPGARAYPGHTGSLLDMPSKTLKAGDHGVPGGENMLALPHGQLRYVTVREAARLQTFPDSWRFHGPWGETMRQLGNAVPMRLAEIVSGSIATALKVCSARRDALQPSRLR